MSKHPIEPEYLQVICLDHLTEIEQQSLLEFIAVKFGDGAFEFEGKYYVNYASYAPWQENYKQG